MHGCCKGATDQESVEGESRNAALAVGAQPERVRTPYYTCELNRRVVADGHPASLPDDCSPLAIAHEMVLHDDADWNQAMLELIEDPANQARLERLGLVDSEAFVPEGLLPWFLSEWSDVHTYLSRGHEPLAKKAVWDAIRPSFDGAISGDYVLIAHSLGSIISGYLIGFEFIKQPKVFVTVGSQLGWSALVRWPFRWLRRFHLDGTWVNIIDRDDLSAGFFTRDNTPADNGFTADDYLDLWVENLHPTNDHDFVGYMSTSEAAEQVGPLL